MGSSDKKRTKNSKKKESKKRHRSSSSSESSNHENDFAGGRISLSERLQFREEKDNPPRAMKLYDDFDVPLREKSIRDTSKQSPEYSQKEKLREQTPEVKRKSSFDESPKRSRSKKSRHQSPHVTKASSDETPERERNRKNRKKSPESTESSSDESPARSTSKKSSRPISETTKSSQDDRREKQRSRRDRHRSPEETKSSITDDLGMKRGRKDRRESPETAKSFFDQSFVRLQSRKMRNPSPKMTKPSFEDSPERQSNKKERHQSPEVAKSSFNDSPERQRRKGNHHDSPPKTKSPDDKAERQRSRKTRNPSPKTTKPSSEDSPVHQRSRKNFEDSPDRSPDLEKSSFDNSSDNRKVRERLMTPEEPSRTKKLSRKGDSSPEIESVEKISDDDRGRRKDKDRSHKNGKPRDTEKNRRRDNERRRKRSRSQESRQPSPNEYEQSRSRKDYRHEDRYSRNNDRRGGNEFTGRRYWDNDRGDRKRDRYHDSDEEYVIGERFYGGESKNSGRRDRGRNNKENINSSNDRTNIGGKSNDNELEEGELEAIPASQKRTVDLLTSKTGGAYIPPAKLRLMQAEITDKSGAAYQRIAWEALKKSIHGHINKINTSNIGLITRELLRENIVRGRGLLARSIIQAQAASPTFTPVYAALTAVINSKFPDIGKLLLTRLVNQFRRAFRLNNKPLCISTGTFVAHLVNQNVAHEILGLELLTLLLDTPNNDSVEVAIAFLKECGMKLTEVSRKGIEAIFEMLRNILHEGNLDKRVQYMIEVMFQIRKDGFKDHEAVPTDLDLIEEEDQITHLITLDEVVDSQDILNVFKLDPEFVKNEEEYKQLSKEILDTDDSSGSDDDGEDDDSSGKEESDEEAEKKEAMIIDSTETNLIALRRTIYLTIHASLDFEECAHKLIKMQLKPGQEAELCHMFLDCCAEMRTYEKFFGLLAGRFCAINKIYIAPFEQMFKDSFDTIHRLEMNKLRNVAKFFAHLLFTDSISWNVLGCIKLNEDDTTSSSRIFIKILFQELSEYMGLVKLNARVKDVTLQEAFEGLFPRDDPKNTRFAINFFTSIGLGGLTDDLREHLKNRPKPPPPPPTVKAEPSSSSESSASSSSSSSSSDSSSDSSDSSSSSSSSSSDDNKKKKKKQKTKHMEKNRKEVIDKNHSKSTKRNSDKKKKKSRKSER